MGEITIFNKAIRLLNKSIKHVGTLEKMVNKLLETNAEITGLIQKNMNEIEVLQKDIAILQVQRKTNHGIINNLNNIIKGEE